MINIKDINDNVISRRIKERYEKLSDETKEKLAKADNLELADYQLRVIKKSKQYPEVGDIFELKASDGTTLQGIVLSNHINNNNGEDLICVVIFREGIDVMEILEKKIEDYIIFPPFILGKQYWTRGFFNTIGHFSGIIDFKEYGFYSIGKGKFLDEYGIELKKEPRICGTYGVSTINGVAMEITRELIILRNENFL